jgi:hypothetical protein
LSFEYPRLERIDGPNGRLYVTPFGPAPSVTTILGSLPKPGLDEWRRRVGDEEADRIMVEAASIGTRMHSYLQAHLEGREPEPADDDHGRIGLALASKIRMLALGPRNLQEVWGVECTLHFEGLYAGTADLVGVYNGMPAVVDFKSSIRPKRADWIEGYKLQTVAYALAHDHMFGTDIRRAVVLVGVRPGDQGPSSYQRFIIEGSELAKYSDMWLRTVETYTSGR